MKRHARISGREKIRGVRLGGGRGGGTGKKLHSGKGRTIAWGRECEGGANFCKIKQRGSHVKRERKRKRLTKKELCEYGRV